MLVRLAKLKKHHGRVFKLKKLEEEGVMVEETEGSRRKNKKKEEKEDRDY